MTINNDVAILDDLMNSLILCQNLGEFIRPIRSKRSIEIKRLVGSRPLTLCLLDSVSSYLSAFVELHHNCKSKVASDRIATVFWLRPFCRKIDPPFKVTKTLIMKCLSTKSPSLHQQSA